MGNPIARTARDCAAMIDQPAVYSLNGTKLNKFGTFRQPSGLGNPMNGGGGFNAGLTLLLHSNVGC